MNKTVFLLLNCIIACNTLSAMENQLVKPTGATELVKASERGDVENVKALLAAGTDVNGQDVLGNTALHIASTVEMARLLLSHGAKVNIPNALGCTPVYQAVFYAHHDIVKLLIEQGALITDYVQPIHPTTGLSLFRDLSSSLNKESFRDNPSNFLFESLDYLSRANLPLDGSYIFASMGIPLIEMAELRGHPQTPNLLKFCIKLERDCKAERLAFYLAKQERLGAHSPAALLDQHTITAICSHIRPAELINDLQAVAKYSRLKIPQQHKKSKTCIVC